MARTLFLCSVLVATALVASCGDAPPAPTPPAAAATTPKTPKAYEDAIRSVGASWDKSTSIADLIETDLETCKRLGDGRMDAFYLRWNMGIGYIDIWPTEDDRSPRANMARTGRRLTGAIPHLCIDQVHVLADALKPTAKMRNLLGGNDRFQVFDADHAAIAVFGWVIQPGVWRTKEPVKNCIWQRRDQNGVVVEDGATGGEVARSVTVTILESDSEFFNRGCGGWRRVD